MGSEKRYNFPEAKYEMTVRTAVVYSMKFPGSYSGWAIFTVCDATGEFSIQSDWGNFSYRWNINHLGNEGKTTLTEFLAGRNDHDYIVNKLSYDNPALQEEYDEDTMLQLVRRHILEERRSLALDQEDARDLWVQIEQFCAEVADRGLDSAFYNYNPDFYLLFEKVEVYEFIARRKPAVYDIVCHELMPRFAEFLREKVLKGEKECSNAG